MPAFAWTRAQNEKHLNVKLAPGTVETDASESRHLDTKPAYVASMLKFVFRLNFRKMEDEYSSCNLEELKRLGA